MNELALVKSITEGVASEEEKGLALRHVQTQLSCTLIASLQIANSQMEKLNKILDTSIDRFVSKYEETLDADLLSYESAFEIVKEIQQKQIQIMELYRKIIQSPNKLFSDNGLSAEEKTVIKLFKSFRSEEEKKKFLELCSKALEPQVEDFKDDDTGD